MDIVPLLIHILSQIDFGPLPYPISPLNRPSTHMGLEARKPVFGSLRTTQAQTSLRVRADWSAPLLFAFWKVSYL